ncbi:MAG: acetyl-CoA carboxylase biotin carboxyl carrier protein, partial [Candidatus Brocadiales bacterium]
DNSLEISSPMVGTFYRAATPGAEPHVEVGDTVDPETVVCVIEAMKIINEIKAEVTGKVAEILVEDGAPVEFGQPLFRVQPSPSGG